MLPARPLWIDELGCIGSHYAHVEQLTKNPHWNDQGEDRPNGVGPQGVGEEKGQER